MVEALPRTPRFVVYVQIDVARHKLFMLWWGTCTVGINYYCEPIHAVPKWISTQVIQSVVYNGWAVCSHRLVMSSPPLSAVSRTKLQLRHLDAGSIYVAWMRFVASSIHNWFGEGPFCVEHLYRCIQEVPVTGGMQYVFCKSERACIILASIVHGTSVHWLPHYQSLCMKRRKPC